MAVTRKQVAEHAGVSEATISYVVNDGPRPVAPATRQRVLEAIRELGYHPSDVARSLRRQRTSTIGLILPDTANPFYGELARIIENFSYAEGYTVILCNSNLDGERERDYIDMLRARRVEGIVIIPTSAEAVARRHYYQNWRYLIECAACAGVSGGFETCRAAG
jgi:LacI family transcriptional regulator